MANNFEITKPLLTINPAVRNPGLEGKNNGTLPYDSPDSALSLIPDALKVIGLGFKAFTDGTHLEAEEYVLIKTSGGDWSYKKSSSVEETQTTIQQPTLVGNILTIKYTGENGILQEQTVDLSGLATIDVTITDASYNTSTNIITLTDTKGDTFNIDLSEFSILVSIDANGIATLTQEGVTKLQISKVGRTGDYNDLLNKPTTYPPDTHIHSQYVTLDTAQTITGLKDYSNGFDMNSYQFRGLNSNVLIIGKNVFGTKSNIDNAAIAVGNNVFPSMNLQPFDPVTEYWNNKGFLGIGSDIFVDYTGDTNYRPDHNAHDSWVGLGRGLGAGFLDGTNVTLVGTGLLGKNDVKYADCVTIIGKGFTNGRKTRADKTLDPNRVVPSKNGYNAHGMMSDVIGIGHENWIEDINQSVVVGSNLRPYTYVFNSLVLGHHHVNMNFEGTTEQADMYLDSDIIMGMGVGKRSSRHAPSHNLLIGMDYFYSTGGAPNANYRPLIEGRFKDGAQLQVNGTIIGGFEKLDDDLPYLERVTFESVSLPSGVVYNASERSFTFDGTQASTSIALHNIPTNPNRYVYIEISGSNHIAGSWGYSVYNAVDNGNGPTENYIARHTFKTVSPTTFILTTEGNFKGTIHITCDYTDVTLRSINPNILLKDSKERKSFEIRTTQDPSIVSMGLNSGKFLTHGGKTLILGNDILSETPAATNNVLVGNNIFKLGSDLKNNVVLGNAIGGNNTNITHSVLIGNGNLQSNFTNNVARLTIVGHGAGRALTAGTYNNLFGEIAGLSLTTGSSNAFFGSASGLIKEGSNNTFIGHAAGGYGLMQSTVNNTIVIGAGAVPEVPNNTTTIATAANTDNFLYGTTHSDSFKVRGGLATQVMMANGTTKNLNEITTDAPGKEDKSNKQNNLTPDGTGIKYPTVDAVNAKNSSQDSAISTETATRSGVENLMHHFWDSNVGKWVSSKLKFVAGVINQLEFDGRMKLADLILPPNNSPNVANRLWSDGTDVYYDNGLAIPKKFAYVGDPITQTVKTISANTMLDDGYHNAIVRVTANCSITVPNTLRADFNCVFEAYGIVTATFVEGGTAVFSAPFGRLLKDNLMCNLYKVSSTGFRLNGGLVPA